MKQNISSKQAKLLSGRFAEAPVEELSNFNRVDLSEITLAVSDAVDLVGVKVLQHGKRVAFMALETARAFGIEESEIGRAHV